MRTAVLFATAPLVGALLLGGCSAGPDSRSGATRLTPITPSTSRPATPAPSSTATSGATSTTPAAAAPRGDAPIAEAIAWVEAAAPVDAAEFTVALRGATTTRLGEDVAFTTPAGTSCMTDVKRSSADLACLVDLTDPPPQPPDTYGVWKGGWVDFDGAGVRVGSAHGDPGRFAAGQGPPLPAGRSLSFGDFRCRTDTDTLICVNYARQTAVRYADDGIEAFGCARQSPPAAGVGIQYNC